MVLYKRRCFALTTTIYVDIDFLVSGFNVLLQSDACWYNFEVALGVSLDLFLRNEPAQKLALTESSFQHMIEFVLCKRWHCSGGLVVCATKMVFPKTRKSRNSGSEDPRNSPTSYSKMEPRDLDIQNE